MAQFDTQDEKTWYESMFARREVTSDAMIEAQGAAASALRDSHTNLTPLGNFIWFLTSAPADAYRFAIEDELRNRNLELGPCLLDMVYAWMRIGDGTRICSSFEDYLVALIQIIAAAKQDAEASLAAGEARYVSIDDFPIWTADTMDPEAKALAIPLARDEELLVRAGVEPGFRIIADPLGHPALNRSAYQRYRSIHQMYPLEHLDVEGYGFWRYPKRT